MENRFGAPASGTPEGSARREFELLLLLGGSRKAAVQLWLRKQRIYANAQQAAGRPATEAKGPREAAERQAGGESKPETAAQAARRHRSERRLREKHLARKVWARSGCVPKVHLSAPKCLHWASIIPLSRCV